MSAMETLPGLDSTTSEPVRTSQWRLECLQVANWGGFTGVHTLTVDPASTLLSGQSGTGKSTLLDAYLALMMPANTAFNGASNDTGGGRVRGEEQRSLLSYLRGQIDTTTDEDHRAKAKVLRGDGKPTCGAIAGRFVDDAGRRFTAVRMYYVPASATKDGDIVQRMATADHALDLQVLMPFAEGRFQHKDLKAAFPMLETPDGPGAFIDKVCKRLRIGEAGDGRKALSLLARIQAGRQIRTVDDLFKAMVLEEPGTFAAADLALAHFDELDDTYQKMITEQDKAQLLAPLAGHAERRSTAQVTLDQLSALGLDAVGLSPLAAWETNQEAALTADAEATTRRNLSGTEVELGTAKANTHTAESEHHDAVTAYNEGGGNRVQQLESEILSQQQEQTRREARRAQLASAADALDVRIEDLDDAQYARLSATAQDFLASFRADEAAYDAELGQLAGRILAARDDTERLTAEIQDATDRPGRVPANLDRQRMQVCQATGMTREDLPFIAELLDVPASQERWRTAIEVSLAGAARRMAVPADRIREVSAAIDAMNWTSRMWFEDAPTGLPLAPAADPQTVAGKLDFAEGPYSGWVSRYVSDPRRNATCVHSAAELAGPGMRVTEAGQTRNGTSYAHGRAPHERNIIGFDNTAVVADLQRELEEAERNQATLTGEYDTVQKRRDLLRRRHGAYAAITQVPFEDIDVLGCRARITELERARESLLSADDTLAALQDQLETAKGKLSDATKSVGALEQQLDVLNGKWQKLVTRADRLTNAQIAHEAIGDVDPDALAQLEAWWVQSTDADSRSDLDDWPANRKNLRDRLASEQKAARTALDGAIGAIEHILGTYQRLYYDPNLHSTIDGLADYLVMYEEIEATGLAARSQEWRDRLLAWSGEDLVPLTQAMNVAIEDIRSRLTPVNDILRKLPFGATDDRLKIALRAVPDSKVLAFRRELIELSSGATRDLDPEQMRARFERLKKFMAKLRLDNDPRVDRNVANRRHLLDVRLHVHVTAQRLGAEREVLATYDSLGGKSGGETQELIAFIVGAALRYRLGDQLLDRPQFAPVFLDEAFIKADAEFSGRAVRAWLGLGFQLVIGAPTDKVAALEPYMNALVSITKDHTTNRSYLAVLTDVERRALLDQVTRTTP